MPTGDEFKGGYWTDGEIEYLRNTLHFTEDQIRNLVETYPDGAASAGIILPNNVRRGQDYVGGLYGNPVKPGFTWVPGTGWVQNNTDPRNNPPNVPPPAPVDYSTSFTDPTQFFDPNMIENLYNLARGGVARAAGGAVSAAQRTAGAQAGASNLLNPQAYITGAGSQARSPYTQVQGQLETNRAGALQQNQSSLYQALFNKQQAEQAAKQFGMQYQLSKDQFAESQKQFSMNYDLQWQNLLNQQQQSNAGLFDYLGLIAKTGAGLAPWIFGKPK